MPQEPIRVEVDGLGVVEFPAGTSDAKIQSVLMNATKKGDESTWAGTLADMGIGVLKGVGQTAVGAGRLVQMVPGVKAGVDALYGQPGLSDKAMDAADAYLAPTNTAQSIGKGAEQVLEAVGTGGAVRKAGQFAVTKAAPVLSAVVGQGLGKALPKIATEAAAGGLQTYLQGGDATTGAVMSGAMPAIAQGGRAVRNAAFGGKANPIVQEAIDFAARPGVDIPIEAATATQRPIVQTLQKAATDSLGGAGIADRFKATQTEALQRVGNQLKQTAHPEALSGAMAGEGVQKTVEGVVKAENTAATKAYNALRDIEARPENLKRVQVGTQTVDGVTVPVMDDVAMPVDMRPVKDALRPVLEAIEKTWNVTKKDASDGLVALRNLVHGADAVSASTADANLGLIKKIVREAESPELMTRGQGLAAQAVGELEGAVQQAVRAAGPEAAQALRAGPTATIAKYTAADVLDQIKGEPKAVFDALTHQEDGGVKLLRQVKAQAPGEMPKVGRAYLEGMLTKAVSEGEFEHTQRMLHAWENMGAETKATLFPNPAHRKDLDNFFLIAKKIGENPNPSGTARQITAMNLMWLLPANGLARVFYSPAGVRQLTKGISQGDTGAVTEALGRVTANRAAHAAR